MTTVFLDGAAASGVSGLVCDNVQGWTGVTTLGACLVLIALAIWAVAAFHSPSRVSPEPG